MGNNPIGIVDPDGGLDGPGDMEFEYELAIQQMDDNLYGEISMTGPVYLANDVTFKPNISDYALDVLWVYSQVYDPDLYANVTCP